MTAFRFPSRSWVALAGVALLALAACDEKDIILPGEREDIRPQEDLASSGIVQQTEIEGSISIRLPSQTSNTSWPQSHASAQFRTAHPALSANPRPLWDKSIGEGDSRKFRITAQPIVGGGRIYTLDASSRVTATATNGGTIWSTDIRLTRDESGDATGGGLAYDNGILYVSSGYGVLTALDAATGAIRWTQRLDATGSGDPLVANGLVYLVAGDDTGWAVETETGRIAWQVAATPSVANVLGAPAPVLAGGLSVFAFGSGELIATFQQGGLRRWAASVAGQRVGRVTSRVSDLTGAPVVAGQTIYAGNHSGRLVAFDAVSGSRIWTVGEGATDPVWPAGDSIFAITDRSELLRVEASSGQIIWRVELPGFLKDRPRRRDAIVAHHGPVLAGGQLIVTSNDGFMRLFSPEDGRLVSSIEIPGGATTAPVVAGSTLYVVSTRGQLHAFR